MATPQQRIIPWDDYRVLIYSGLTTSQAAERLGVPTRTITRQLVDLNIDLSPSLVPAKVWLKYPDIQPPSSVRLEQAAPGSGLALSWQEVQDYLSTGLSLEETATACGVDVDGLKESYSVDRPADYDSLGVWAAVLRARRTYDLLKAAERRALDGDLRSLMVLQKYKYQRWPKDSLPPPAAMHDL